MCNKKNIIIDDIFKINIATTLFTMTKDGDTDPHNIKRMSNTTKVNYVEGSNLGGA